MLNLKKTQHLVYIGLLATMAIVINLVECYFIPPIHFGIRLGLANIIALITVVMMGPKELIYFNILRVMLGGLLRGIIFGASFWISLGGIILSSVVLILCRQRTSIYFMSIISAIAHTTGQVLVVSVIYSEIGIASLLPLLIIVSMISGWITGFIAIECIKRVRVC